MSVFDDIHEEPESHAPQGLWRAKIAATPATFSAPVFVTIPAFGDDQVWGPCTWRGNVKPLKGANAIVAFDSNRQIWLLSWAGGSPGGSYGTIPPTNPQDGDEWLLPVGNGVLWRFRYNAGSASSYKWEFIGGSPLAATVLTSENTSSTTFVDLPLGAGPSVTVPREGEYFVKHGMDGQNTTVNTWATASVRFGSTAPIATDQVTVGGQAVIEAAVSRELPIKTLTLNDVVKQQYQRGGTGPTVTFKERWLSMSPVRVL